MTLSPEEKHELARSAAQFLDSASGHDQIRALVDSTPIGRSGVGGPDGMECNDGGHEADPMNGTIELAVWKQVVELGWTGIHVPERLGGAGAGYDALAVILHEMGRHLTPGPFLSSSVVATEAFLHSSNRAIADDVLARMASGDVRAAPAIESTDLRWRRDGRSIVVGGRARFVLDGYGADIAVLVAHSEKDGPLVVVVDGFADSLKVKRVPTVDRTRALADLWIDELPVLEDHLLAEHGDQSRILADRMSAVGAIAVAADAAAAAERVTEMSVEYAKNRVQFGRPVGSFQAVKHHCANMAIAVEASKAAVRAGFEALDGMASLPGTGDPAADINLAAHVASSYAGPACSRVCALAIQVHGGIGFTWEHDAHLYLKRVKLDEMLFGSARWHRRRLAAQSFPRISPRWSDAGL